MEILQVLICVGVTVFLIASVWKTFAKAGQPGWASVIPIYNTYVVLKMGGKPGWWLLLLLIPLVNVVAAILASIAVAERFGRSQAFGVGLALLGFIFYPILGFGKSKYMQVRYAKAA
jgi:hypothetical protein